ncbi:hypothetical protein [Peribacillus tepidiphilus]|jgi:hypothetical protein|uniref:hypothetical protein n=1 Tax=Peribacillus tepidiphilus TaxID=2652445 RepID=UPI0012924BA4|nr:hypothetical protein [Peribacillus tepidiphilus]
MKKFFKVFLGVFGAFFLVVAILLITDISNDVEYKVVETKKQPDSVHLRVTTEVKDEKSLRTIADEVKKDNKGVDAVWLWIHDTSDEPFGKLLATVRIPYNNKGKAMVGAESLDYVFELK